MRKKIIKHAMGVSTGEDETLISQPQIICLILICIAFTVTLTDSDKLAKPKQRLLLTYR